VKRSTASVLVAVALATASCSSHDDARPTVPTTSDTTETSSAPATTTITSTTSEASTSTSPTSTTDTSTVPTTEPPTSTTLEPECDVDAATAILDSTIELARLSPGGPWSGDTDEVAFDERTDSAEGFARMVAYGCTLRLAQRTDSGAERLALIGWNERRHVLVIQATDAPSEPYRTDVLFQLFLEQPYGELLEDQSVWAAAMAGGESIIIGTHDASAGLTAKSWQSEIPPFDDLPVTLESEQYGIDALVEIGARNVSVAEPASYGYPIGTLQFHTPIALIAFAVIGPADSFDPMVPIVPDGTSSYQTIDGVEVRLTTGKELDQFDLYETGWSCGDHAWRLYSSNGTPDELLEFTGVLVRSLDC
jgi:hypothetical protein